MKFGGGLVCSPPTFPPGGIMRLLTAIVLVLSIGFGSALAQGLPHSLLGYVENNNGTIPTTECLTFWAFFLPDSDTIYFPEDSGSGGGTNYLQSLGAWLVETSTFTPPIEDGDLVYIGFRNICNGETGLTTIVMDLTVSVQEVPLMVLADMTVQETTLPGQNSLRVFPNPFNSECRIILPEASTDRVIEIFDVRGRKMRSIDARNKSSIIWDGLDNFGNALPSGMYLIKTGKAEPVNVIMLK